MGVTINCDMGEGFGLYECGDDTGLMPFVDIANVACGFHASDPSVMRATVALAARHGVAVGAHPSFPDLQGFGRREMKMDRDELAACLIYQIGALKGFLDEKRLTLNHIKPHGALYGAAMRHEHVANAIADAAQIFDVPLLCMRGTLQEDVYAARGVPFLAEYYADLDYDAAGGLIITRKHEAKDPEEAARRVKRVLLDNKATTIEGTLIDMQADTICVHSDTPGAVDLARAVRQALDEIA
ncbi:5-oxoprolinase subunit PxpA [Jiella pacifica]|uniref:5-oxoprolinase subunit PxpA n=1 Tax=Jiella pacifica TaxID=2696469 RepID=A0A6N9T7E3_9HYPH|nr:5-oxoprolinase subunit PxpA [Jiella pacifica]NDW05669.1 5-oxoprolinase subunit PxpA [Jiella pacifica]